MELETVVLGNHLRTFTSETCATFSIKELHHEAEAWTRCQAQETLLKQGVLSRQQNNTYASTRKVKTLNLQTYKLHALGDYMEQIWTYGTIDSYSMQSVSYQGLVIHWSLGFYFLGGAWAPCWKK